MAYNLNNAKRVLNALINAGANPVIIPFLMAQIAHETGDFDSKVFRENNNASGIMFINKSKQKNATKGNAFPSKEGNHFYANFATLKDWAVDYLRIIGNTPQKATSLNDYAQKLKNNGYYTDTVSNYANALNAHFKALNKAGILGGNLGIPTVLGSGLILLGLLFFFSSI